jgi:hypothetical protein
MSSTIPNSFKVAFDDEVKLVYQDKGQRLKSLVRTAQSDGATYTFQVLGKGEASPKARGSQIPRMGLNHTAPVATLVKRYAAEPIDDLDRYVQSYDELSKLASICTMAVGRAEDTLIRTEIVAGAVGASNTIAHSAKGWTLTKAKMLHRHFGQNHIFDSGMGKNVVFVTSAGFEDLLDIPGFASADYIAPDQLPFKQSGLQGKVWLGLEWYTWDSLDHNGSTHVTTNIAFNTECVGYAHAKEIVSKVYENEDTDEIIAMAKMYGGAKTIDSDGLVVVYTYEPDLSETA